jgi:hypothetical protein
MSREAIQSRFATLGTTTVPEAYEPEWDRLRPKLLRLKYADRDMVKGRHEVRCDLSRFLFSYGVGRILFTGLKDVFQRATIPGCASIPKQLYRHGWNRQQEGNQDCGDGTHALNLAYDMSIKSSLFDTFRRSVDAITMMVK